MRIKNAFLPIILGFVLTGCGATTQSAAVKESKADPIAKVETVEKTVAALPVESLEKEDDPSEKNVPLPRRQFPEVTILMGKSVDEIEQVFGRPVLQRKDKPAEIWQYLTSECALHLVFYPAKNSEQNDLIVQHVSMNGRQSATEVDSRECFGSQLRKVGEERLQTLS